MGGTERGRSCPRFRAWTLVLALVALQASVAQARLGTSGTFSPAGSGAGLQQNATSIGDWVDRAVTALAASDFASAQAIASAALEVDGTNSDLLYLLARASFAVDGEVRTALAGTKAALLSDHFSHIARADAVVFAAELEIRLRHWEACLSLLQGADNAPDARVELRRIEAYVGRGDRASALRSFEMARSLWPADARFATLFFKSWKGNPDDSSRRLADFYIRRATQGDFEDPALTALAIPFMPDQNDRKTTLLALRAAKGAVASIEALRYGLIDSKAAVAELLPPGATRIDRSDLAALVGLCGPAGIRALEARLTDFNGRLFEDADGDGIPDAVTTYKNGQPVEWARDADQDGVDELVVHFTYGLPSSAEWHPSGASFAFVWGRWPHLLSARQMSSPIPAGIISADMGDQSRASGAASADQVQSPAAADQGQSPAAADQGQSPADGSGRLLREWSLGGGSLSWSPVALSPYPDAASAFILVDRRASEAPGETALTAASATMVLHRAGGDFTFWLRDGVILRAIQSVDGRTKAKISYDGGKPLLEKLDQDGDGRFESRLHLDPKSDPLDPLVLSYESDVDGDGVYEFSEQLVPPYRRAWDLGTPPAARGGQ
ncbi:MAG: hypothetical protein M0001_10670 [Treponema sp.]|nr:hypothetical protein [Treponema sp.]